MQCPATLAKATWDNEIAKLQSWLQENNSDPDLAEAVIENLRAWQSLSPYPAKRYTNRTLRKALFLEDRIGWQSFIEGFIVSK